MICKKCKARVFQYDWDSAGIEYSIVKCVTCGQNQDSPARKFTSASSDAPYVCDWSGCMREATRNVGDRRMCYLNHFASEAQKKWSQGATMQRVEGIFSEDLR